MRRADIEVPNRAVDVDSWAHKLIPGVPLSVEPTALPLATAGSLRPAFAPARPVCLAVKLPCAFALCARFPTVLRELK